MDKDLIKKLIVADFIEALIFAERESTETIEVSSDLKILVEKLVDMLIEKDWGTVAKYFVLPASPNRSFGHSLYFQCKGHGSGFFDHFSGEFLLELDQMIKNINFYGDLYEEDNIIYPDGWRFYNFNSRDM